MIVGRVAPDNTSNDPLANPENEKTTVAAEVDEDANNNEYDGQEPVDLYHPNVHDACEKLLTMHIIADNKVPKTAYVLVETRS